MPCWQVVDEIEESTGAPLDPNNKEGWSQLQSRVEVRCCCRLLEPDCCIADVAAHAPCQAAG